VFVHVCGKSLVMIWLTEQEYQVIGIESSNYSITVTCPTFFNGFQVRDCCTETVASFIKSIDFYTDSHRTC
jgi:hypothetical protein